MTKTWTLFNTQISFSTVIPGSTALPSNLLPYAAVCKTQEQYSASLTFYMKLETKESCPFPWQSSILERFSHFFYRYVQVSFRSWNHSDLQVEFPYPARTPCWGSRLLLLKERTNKFSWRRVLCFVMSCTMSCHVVYDVVSCRVVLCCVVLCGVVSCVMSCRAVLCRVVSCRVVWGSVVCCVVSYCVCYVVCFVNCCLVM